MPPVELLDEELELLVDPVDDEDEEDDEEDEDEDDEELEPEQFSAVTFAPEMVIASTLATPSAVAPERTKRFEPWFNEISTVSSTHIGQPPVGSKLNVAALPASPLAVKVPERALVAPLA